MSIFEHYILTRFNVSVDGFDTRAGLDPDWLKHRFDLFDTFCYPSVRGQSLQNFRWLVFFNSATPQFFREKINYYASWEKFVPVFVDWFDKDVCRREVLRSSGGNTKYLITTRLDNDDAIFRYFVETIQDNFSKDFFFLNFPFGCVWHNKKIYVYRSESNPFISLVEPKSICRTVYCGDHGYLSRIGPVRQIGNRPSWLQIIHGRNVANKINGDRYPIKKLEDFDINVNRNLVLCWFDQGEVISYKVLRKVYKILSRVGRLFLEKIRT